MNTPHLTPVPDGEAAFEPNQIDHLEVMTFDGRKVVQVKA